MRGFLYIRWVFNFYSMRHLFTVLVFFLTFSSGNAQTEPKRAQDYCIMHAFGPGHNTSYKGAFIVYPNLLVERRMLLEDNETAFLKLIMEAVNAIKLKGYTLVSSSMAPSDAGLKCEYVFSKDE
jgi:hypothetical protein